MNVPFVYYILFDCKCLLHFSNRTFLQRSSMKWRAMRIVWMMPINRDPKAMARGNVIAKRTIHRKSRDPGITFFYDVLNP